MKELDEYFKKKGCKIVLFLDNAPMHIVNEATNLANVELHYFSPNLTSVLQPFDVCIIQSLKVLSRKFEILSILDNINDSLHASDLVKKLIVLDLIKFIYKSWSMVKAETIKSASLNVALLLMEKRLKSSTRLLHKKKSSQRL